MLEIRDVRLVLDAQAALAECPLWSVAEQKLYWVDISGRAINRFDPATGENQRWPMPCEPGCIALAAGGGLVAALRDGFYRFYPADGGIKKIADAPYDTSQFRFNDGRCDAAGRFWAGAMYEPRTAELAGVYCLERGRVRSGWGPEEHLGVKVSNGMAFTADGGHVFQSDTPNHVIYRFGFDVAAGKIGARAVFARRPDNRTDASYGGRPDGAAIDSRRQLLERAVRRPPRLALFPARRGNRYRSRAGQESDDGCFWRAGFANALHHHRTGRRERGGTGGRTNTQAEFLPVSSMFPGAQNRCILINDVSNIRDTQKKFPSFPRRREFSVVQRESLDSRRRGNDGQR